LIERIGCLAVGKGFKEMINNFWNSYQINGIKIYTIKEKMKYLKRTLNVGKKVIGEINKTKYI